MKSLELSINEKILTFEDHNIKRIPENYFCDYGQLEELYFQSSNLKRLQSKDFQYLGNVKRLELNLRTLKRIRKQSFTSLTHLEILIIVSPNLRQLSNEAFADLTLLKELRIDSCKHFHIFSHFFHNIPNLEILEISTCFDNFLIEVEAFESISLLQNLYLHHTCELNSNLFVLDYNIFQYLSNLVELTIDNHLGLNIDDDDNDIFRHLSNLESLKIRGSVIRFCSFLYRLPNLSYLDLSNNSLTIHMNIDEFRKSTKLTLLKLSYNPNLILFNNCFRQLDNLISLDLSYSGLSLLDSILPQNNRLKYFYINSHRLKKISYNDFRNFTNLKTLQLNDGLLEVIESKTFKDLSNLEILLLNDNFLNQFPDNIFKNLSNLRLLNLSYNLLYCFQGSWFGYKSMCSLETLNLRHNQIRVLSSFQIFFNLKSLNLMSNEFQFVSSVTFLNLRHLTYLNMSCNKYLEVLHETVFDSLRNLKVLLLNRCGLRDLPVGVFDSLVCLKYLDLSHNRLERLNDNLLKFNQYLVNLNLNNNSIMTIPENFFAFLRYLEVVDISYNGIESVQSLWFSDLACLKSFIVDSNMKRMFRDIFYRHLTRSQILPGLYIGSYRDSKDFTQIQRFQISHIVSIHDTPKQIFNDRHYLCIIASDKPNQNLLQYFSLCNDFMHAARLRDGNVLIHCLIGMSRSVTIVIAYIMSITDLTWKEALKVIKASRSIANPNIGFQKQLQDFEIYFVHEERNRLRERYPSLALKTLDIIYCHEMIKSYDNLLMTKSICEGQCRLRRLHCPTGICNKRIFDQGINMSASRLSISTSPQYRYQSQSQAQSLSQSSPASLVSSRRGSTFSICSTSSKYGLSSLPSSPRRVRSRAQYFSKLNS